MRDYELMVVLDPNLDEAAIAAMNTRIQGLVTQRGGTVDNVDELGPAGALTGPVARGDDETLTRHVDALPDDERDAYEALVREARRLAEATDSAREETLA